jgi:SAM-dependent methyltransferase
VIGCDLRPGAGVDRIEDLHALSLADATVGTALVLDTLEHVARPWEAMRELARVLKPGGLVLITSHLYFPLHPCPDDFWRFTSQGLESLATHAELTAVFAQPLRVGQAGISVLPHTVVLLATRLPSDPGTFVDADGLNLPALDVALVVDAWLRRGAQTWRERVFNLLPPVAVAPAYRLLQRIDRLLAARGNP